MDIRDFNKLDDLPDELYRLDILDGSPPCTTFSMAGDREESWGKKKKFREGQAEQTLDDLSFVFIETVNKLRPKTVIMENVEGLLLGEAWSYVQRIYKEFKDIGYTVKHYLCKGERMGIPQTRHRVFFIAVRNDIEFDFDNLNMEFNYEPITYGKIKSGRGRSITKNTRIYKLIEQAIETDIALCDVTERIENKRTLFNYKILNDEAVFPTLTAGSAVPPMRRIERQYCTAEDMINAQTFPQDFDFTNKTVNNVQYICGMSVPPIMTKRVVERLIDTGVFNE
jgi:DNA (cytosine-5)-methyltransferase 1